MTNRAHTDSTGPDRPGPDGPVAAPGAGSHANRRLLGKLLVIAAVMFGFGFALIPIYKAICNITGVGLLTKRDTASAEFARNTQVDRSRTITVEFDANSRGAWLFKPARHSLRVHPGELVTIEYELVNTLARDTVGQAIPSYAPARSAAHFHKLECFCFKQQALQAKATRRFPVVFVVDPRLPKDVDTITLSYTFFDVSGNVGAGQASAPAGDDPPRAVGARGRG